MPISADWGLHTFAVSGVTTWWWLPPLVALVVSFFTSMAGISGAFLLLPFQMLVLGFTTPAVSATNLVFNLVATPGGIWRYAREGRMLLPLVWIIFLATVPGVVIGFWLRVHVLRDPGLFLMFVAVVLLYVGARLLREGLANRSPEAPPSGRLEAVTWSRGGVGFRVGDEEHRFEWMPMSVMVFLVGIIGGIYGIGGGALMAPFCVAFFRLPVHAIAGATLAGTLITSIVGVAIYSFLPAPSGVATAPDWELGLLFGLGGFGGMYLGARCQKFVPAQTLRLGMGLLLIGLACRAIL